MKTKPMGAANIPFLVDKLGEECSPTQQLREFVQNAVEAIQRVQIDNPEYEGDVRIDFDPYWTEKCGAPKLSIVDNGEGMNEGELQRYMNNLSSSGRSQAVDANFGVGAKIASLSLNPLGVIFESWKAGAGHMIHIWRDEAESEYGLKPIPNAEGVEDYVPALNDDAKPSIVTQHGTRVVLLGMDDNDNTCEPPEDENARSEWLVKTLNRRYFMFPPNIRISARTSPYKADPNDSKCPRRLVEGQRNMLDTCAVEKGRVLLRGAVAHWWLLPTEDSAWPNSQASWGRSYEARGHAAILMRSELYLHRFDNSGRFVLQEFGISAGYNAVVIYVEPEKVALNMARSMPQFEGGEPPWHEWGAQFRAQMPKPLADYVENLHQHADKTVNDEIKKALKDLLDLFSPPRFKPAEKGNATHDPSSMGPGGSPEPPPRSTRPRSTPPPITGPRRRYNGPRGHNISDRLKPKGPEAQRVEPPTQPEVEWVAGQEGKEFNDVAAIYSPSTNTIRANRDFRFFRQIAERMEKDFPNRPGSKTVIWHAVERWFGQQLVEAVLGVQSLVSSRSSTWDQVLVDKMLEPEALTVAVCVRCQAVSMIRNACSKSLGRSAPEETQAN